MPDPYDYVRWITLGLGAIWTLRALLRLWRFGQRWGGRLEEIGLERSWMRRQLLVLTLRTTVLDPVNLGLLLLLLGSWSMRSWLD